MGNGNAEILYISPAVIAFSQDNQQLASGLFAWNAVLPAQDERELQERKVSEEALSGDNCSPFRHVDLTHVHTLCIPPMPYLCKNEDWWTL